MTSGVAPGEVARVSRCRHLLFAPNLFAPNLFAPNLFALILFALVGLTAACGEPDWLEEGRVAYAHGELPAAAFAFEQGLAMATADEARAVLAGELGRARMRQGQLDEAERALEGALQTTAPDSAAGAFARRYLGVVYWRQGRHAEAMSVFDALLPQLEANDALKVEIYRAGVAFDRGDLETARAAYASGLERARNLGDRRLEASCLDGLAIIFAHTGVFDAAEAHFAAAGALHAEAERPVAEAKSLGNRAVLALEGGRYEEAIALADQQRARAAASGFAPSELQAEVTAAEAHWRAGHIEAALESLRAYHARRATADIARFDGHAAVVEAHVHLERGEPEALAAAEMVVERLHAIDDPTPYVRAEAAALAGELAAAKGDTATAVGHYVEGIEAFEALRGQLGPELVAGFFVRRRIAVYERLLRYFVELDRPEDAATLVGRLKARALLDRVVQSDAASRRADEWVATVTGMVAGALAWPPADAFELSVARRRLPQDIAVLTYYQFDDALLVFWLSRDALRMHRVHVSREEVRARVIATERRLFERAPALALAADLNWLADRVLAPVRDALESPDHPPFLSIVPHGVLHRLPFEVLPWGDGPLLDAFPVAYAPSLPSLVALLDRPSQAVTTDAVLAVADARGDLPGARVEVGALTLRVPSATRLVGEEATETAVRGHLEEADLHHFAVHGHAPTVRYAGYLDLWSDEVHDGTLYADEIALSAIDADLVTLSACHSGVDTPNTGDEMVDALDRAFLQAGAQAVVSSRWRVDDAAALAFMGVFYDALFIGQGRLEAFATAQRALRAGEVTRDQLALDPGTRDLFVSRGLTAPGSGRIARRDFKHPYFWTSFALKGDYR